MKKNTSFVLRLSVLITAFLITGVFSTRAALADTYTVVVTTDTLSGSCGVSCSLRDAIRAANARAGSDTISIPAGTYTMTFTGAGEEVAATGDFDITDTSGTLTITGAGSETTIIHANELDRIFDIKASTTVVIDGITITNGAVTDEDGAGILNAGTLTLNNSIVSNNTLTATVTDHYGAGIQCSGGSVTISGTTIDGNDSYSVGGPFVYGGGMSIAAGCSGSISESTISNNTYDVAGLQFGGGAYIVLTNSTTFDITDTTIGSNTATIGGGVYIYSDVDGNTVNVNRATIHDNTSHSDGGGVYQRGPVYYTNVTIVDNVAYGSGGGMYFVDGAETVASIAASTIVQNSADSIDTTPDLVGGGMYVAGTSVDLRVTSALLGANSVGSGDGVAFNDCHEPSSNGDSFVYSLLGTTSDCAFATTTHSLLNANSSYLATAMLADNGGAVETLNIWSVSTIDTIPEEDCVDAAGDPLTVDARGLTRPDNDGCDMGSFERDQTVPSAPTSFSAIASGSTVSLSWINPVDVDFNGVTIRRATDTYPTSTTDGDAVATGVTATTQDDSGLSDDTYYYSIFALDTTDNFSIAAQAVVTVDTVTAAPTLFAPVAGSANSVHVQYVLPETPMSGSVQVTFANEDSETTVMSMSTDTSVDITFSPTSAASAVFLANSTTINSIATSFTTILEDGTYSVTLAYRDLYGNPSTTASVTGFVIDTVTQAPTFISPDAGHTNTLRVRYTLPEAVLNSSVQLFFTNSDAQTLTLTMSTGLEIDFSFDPTATLSEVQLANSDILSAGSSFDTALPDGAYTVTLSYQDLLGNAAATTTVTDVVIDTVAPTITLVGEGSVVLTQGDSYSDLGATATDAIDGDLTSAISVEGVVDVNTLGEYMLTYSVADAAGNLAQEIVRTVTVEAAVVEEVDMTPTVAVYGKYVRVIVDSVIVDRARISVKKLKPVQYRLKTAALYDGYTTVAFFKASTVRARLTVWRLNSANELKKKVTVAFPISHHKHLRLKFKPRLKRIIVSVGKGENKHVERYRLTKKGNLKLL